MNYWRWGQCVGLGHSNELLEMGTVCGIRAQQ